MDTTEEIAVRAVQDIYELWQIDPDGAQWVGEASADGVQKVGYGFNWLPGDFQVSVRVHGPHPEVDEPMYRLNVRTDYISGIDVTDPVIFNNLILLNRFCPSFAICTLPKDVAGLAGENPANSEAWLESTGYVHPGIIDWFPKFFGGQTVLQVMEAQFRVEADSQLLHARPNCLGVVRPRSDGTLDGMLAVEEESFIPEGQEHSRWAGSSEFEQIIENWGRTDSTYGNGDNSGLTIEASFGDDSCMLSLYVDQPHPRLGSGLLMVVKLPILWEQNEANTQANDLNFWEARNWTGARVPFVGNWSSSEVSEGMYCVAYTSFIPNMLYQSGLAENMTLWGLSRARCVRETWYPDLVDVPISETLTDRMSQLSE